MPAKLTVIIPCKNEREHIGACIASAQQVADEVLVADSGSTDGTIEIAVRLGCRVIEREYVTSGDFKNWAIPQATHEWVFILDADERITPQLADEIRRTLSEPKYKGYWVLRRNHFMGRPIRFGPWRNDACLRLFRRDVGRYVGPTDHAEVKLSSGTAGRLRTRLTHYTCSSYAQYLPKISRYAEVQARVWAEQGRNATLANLLLRFPLRFVQGYVFRLGFLDGFAGLQVCFVVAYLSWLKQAYLWQLRAARSWQELEAVANPICSANPSCSPAPCSAGGCLVAGSADHDESLKPTATTTSAKKRRRTLREIRRRYLPEWLQTNARRRMRNIVYRRLGLQRVHTPPILIREPSLLLRSTLPHVVSHELLRNPRMTFLQIGAYDGVGEDDLRDLVMAHKLRGVLVEPQPDAFARLQRTYRDQPQVTLLQAAVAEEEGTRKLYCVRGQASMAASFVREHLHKHGIRDRDIVTQEVPCHTVESALRAAGLRKVDLLQIDAEGYDWPIIRSIDFTRLRPQILRFEYRHMGDRDADKCVKLLAEHGYQFIVENLDIIAVQTNEPGVARNLPRRRSA